MDEIEKVKEEQKPTTIQEEHPPIEQEKTKYPERPPNNRSNTSTSGISSDEEYRDDKILIDDGIPAEVPLEALAGPALILPTNDLDGHTLNNEFDWNGKEDDDEEQDMKDEEEKKKAGALGNSSIFICINKNSSNIAWTCIILLALIFIAIDVAIFVVYRERISMTSYGLELWFTWIAFMWCIAFMSQLVVELIPWLIKKLVSFIRPQSIEVLRMRLSYYKALRPYIKLLVISAWAWGSWAFIKDHVPLPVIGQDEYGFNVYQSKPQYVGVFYSIWECVFFALLFLFIEKFILQLIVTSFHKKAYGDRIKENDKALRILDRLKKTKKKNPQEFLLKKIRRKNKTNPNINSGTPSRSHSFDENSDSNQIKNSYYQHRPPQYPPPPPQNKSIMSNQQQYKSNVKFPSQNMDTLIAIPPLEDRVHDDEKHEEVHEQEHINGPEQVPKHGFMNKLKKKMKKPSPGTPNSQAETISGDESTGYHSPAPLSRENTWISQDEKSLFGTTRDFGLYPGKLFKGGYNKFMSSSQNSVKQPSHHNPTAQAKYLARKIFNNLIGDSHRDTVMESDFYPFFKSTKDAQFAFGLFDTDGNGDLTKRELRQGCIRIYRERKNLTRSMRDLSQATGKLDIILMIVFVVVWVIIVCAAFGVDVGTDLMPLWSAFVAASFIFGTSASDAFEAIIFVFVTHPFDSGDRVLVGQENWVVQNVGLLVSTFIKWDGTVVYVKNSVLTTQYIINVRRSGRTGETVDIQISFTTPSWKIKKLTDHMIEWSNQYPKLYTTNSACTNITAFQNQNLINLSFYFEHTQNWQDPGGRWLRHNNFMMELKEECERLDVSYALPTQPFTTGNGGNDAPPESYNMGSKSSYGLDGMVRRRPYDADNDETYTNRPIGATGSGDGHSGPSGNSGAAAGAAATMMFAASM